MDQQRGSEIAASHTMANVTYNGIPIYIDRINQDMQTAAIHYLNNPNQRYEVFTKHLVEHPLQ